jgi:LEA14-like dessication related protein
MGADSRTDDGSGSSTVATLTAALLGSPLRIAGTGVLGLVLAVVVAIAAGAVGVPAVQDFQNEFTGVDDSTTTIGSTIEVTNPNPIGAGFLGVSAEYGISMNDVRMANGSSGTVGLPPGNSTVELATELDNDRIPEWWVRHVRNDEETTVAVNATVESEFLGRSVPVERTRSIETDVLSSFNSTETRPVNASTALVSDPLLYVNETRAQWGEVTDERTGIVVDFYVYNPKSYAIPVSKLNYTIGMNDVRVGAGENTDETLLEPGEVTRVRTVTSIENENLDDWWVTHVERTQRTDVVIDFAMRVEAAGTEIDVPLEGLTHRETIETDVFGTKDDAAPNDARSGNETDDGSNSARDDSTTTAGDGTATGESTTTGDGGSTTSDDGSTTTDDGGIIPSVATGHARVSAP